MLIISLTSIPARFGSLGGVLESLVAQKRPADHIILYIPKRYRRFPDYDGTLPEVPKGVEIRVTEDDFGPASKVLNAVQDFADVEDGKADILFCDDDIRYLPEWTEVFLAARAERPDDAICSSCWDVENTGVTGCPNRPTPRWAPQAKLLDFGYRARKFGAHLRHGALKLARADKPWRNRIARSGHADVFEGLGGVMVQPRFFGPEAFDIPDILWTVDDVWLSGCVTKNGYGIWGIKDGSRFTYTPAQNVEGLNVSVIDGTGRLDANRKCVEYFQQTYGIWGGAV